MKYLILIWSNPQAREVWERLAEAQRVQFGRTHAAFRAELAASGELVASQALADPSAAKRVSVRDGRTLTSDGPFAEVKEHLAGYYLIECEGMERAVELAARVPDAHIHEVEVRPVLEGQPWLES